MRFRDLVLITILALPGTLHAQDSDRYYLCIDRVTTGKGQAWLTGINPLHAKPADVQTAWVKFAKASFDSSGTGEGAKCLEGTLTELQAEVKSVTGIVKQGGGKVTKSDWQYSDAMTAAPATTGGLYAFCTSGTFATTAVYLSDVFEVPKADAESNNAPVEVTFVQFLKQKYLVTTELSKRLISGVECSTRHGNLAQTKAAKTELIEQLKKGKLPVAETGWKYARTPQTPPAGTAARN